MTAAVDRGDRACTPFPLLLLPSTLAQQRACARTYVADRHPLGPASAWQGGSYTHDRLRIGYFSADFHDHATAHLIAGVLEQHDRRRFEITAFSFGPDADDPWRRRIASAVDRFVDVRQATDAAIAAQARALEIDIAVDLKGHTQQARAGIFAARAAPLQASWLGYPGTLGAPYMDYLIADPTLIPPPHRAHYDEKIAYLPHSYQPNDSTKPIASETMTREQAGLPASGVRVLLLQPQLQDPARGLRRLDAPLAGGRRTASCGCSKAMPPRSGTCAARRPRTAWRRSGSCSPRGRRSQRTLRAIVMRTSSSTRCRTTRTRRRATRCGRACRW